MVFIRGLKAALTVCQQRFPDEPIRVMYAGCGPYGTLLLPLLANLPAPRFEFYLIDIHQESIDSVARLVAGLELNYHSIHLICDDACRYQHPRPWHLIVAETMQKSLEQEPQFAVTANLASQLLPEGLFLPERIEVSLHLSSACEKIALGTVFELTPRLAAEQAATARAADHGSSPALPGTIVTIPQLEKPGDYQAVLQTRIDVFGQHRLNSGDAEITLPLCCEDLTPPTPASSYACQYRLGSYPKFEIASVE